MMNAPGTQYLKYFEVLCLPSTRRRCFGPFAYSPNDPFWMVATHILPQVGHRNKNPSANSPDRQFSIRYQVIKPTLTDGGYRRIRVALQPSYILLLAGDGWSEYQGNSGSSGSQDDHDVGAIQSSVTGAQTVCCRADRLRFPIARFWEEDISRMLG